MSHSGHTHMGSGAVSHSDLQQMYWAVVGSAVGAATLANVLNHIITFQRTRDSTLTPSKPKALFFRAYATLTAVSRETSYATLPPISVYGLKIHFAPLGPLIIVLANLIMAVVLCFYKFNTEDQWSWEDIGYRTGFITIAQLPLIFLLAGRQNIIGLLAGIDYQRLNWFHRWVARTVWLCATFHMGFWFRSWGRYNYITYQLQTNGFAKRGVAAWCILTFIVVSSARPIRKLGYEFFVIQHLVMFVGFIAAVWLHASKETKIWVWIPIGLLVFDRVVRYAWATYINLSVFHRSGTQALWANRASFTPLPGNVTRVTIKNPGTKWTPGQHLFLTCHTVAPLQSHPFTIASIPEDNQLEFLVRAEKGGTRRFFRYASKYDQVIGNPDASNKQTRIVLLEGPYGRLRSPRQFDSIVLIAGGMGATLTVPLLRDVVAQWRSNSRLTVTKRIRFVWVIKSRMHLTWFEPQLQSVRADIAACQREYPDIAREIKLSVHITCDEKLEQPPPDTCQSSTARSTSFGRHTRSASTDRKPIATEKDAISIHPGSSIELSSLPVDRCCCTTTIEEEQINSRRCTCSGPASQAQTSSTSPDIPLLSGRPALRQIIRKALERAEGESAVFVCGPQGLSDDVRRSVVYLSDERAVHKGTGAQGVYLHVENFGW
ncbi:FAD-binding domain-containing protein [Aspergillus pseudodeflectus]|uniref:ferric-chelate reductase (NADPH) n=1 Tax=Aspergillus pseudodeflectus TaxID=176178 RepID=A0ABR4JDW3_9EURO